MMGLQRTPVDEVRNDPARHEMRTDGDVRIEFLDELDQRLRVQAIELTPDLLSFPWLVRRPVDPPEERRRLLHQLGVELRVEVAEELVGVLQRILMHHLLDARVRCECLLEGVATPHVAIAGTGRDDENAFLHMVDPLRNRMQGPDWLMKSRFCLILSQTSRTRRIVRSGLAGGNLPHSRHATAARQRHFPFH